MTYKEYVKEVFLDHHDSMGMDIEEAEELFQESTFENVEKWLKRIGYNLEEYHINREYLD